MAKDPREKAARHETKGDEFSAKGRHDKALKAYRAAHDLDPENSRICDKMIRTRDLIPGEWDMEDFAESVGWAMEQQAREHPPIHQVHARLSPEWAKATTLALAILGETDDDQQRAQIEELAGMGEIATRAMIGFLLELKKAQARDGESDAPTQGEGSGGPDE